MIGLDERSLMAGFVIFCRVGTCLSFAPGFSSPRIPVRFRLFIALGLTLALAPPLLADPAAQSIGADTVRLGILMVRECAIGATLGLIARFLFASLETAFTVASMAIGLTSSFAPRIDEGESMPELAAIVVFAATTMLFVTNLHWEILRAMSDSYVALPLGASLKPGFALGRIVETLSFGLSIAFGLAAPFIVFGVVANFAFALLNRITPQIAIYFVVTPLILFCGIAMLPLVWPEAVTNFLSAFAGWLGKV